MKEKWPYLKEFLRDERKLVGLTFLVSLLSNIFTVLIPISMGKYFNLVFDFGSRKSGVLDVLPSYLWNTIEGFTIFFVGLVLCKIVLTYLEKYWIGVLGERLAFRIRNELFEHQLYMNMREYEKGIGKYLLRYSGDLKGVQTYLSVGIIRFASDMVLMTVSFVVLFLIDFWLFAIILGFMSAMLYAMHRINNYLYKASESHRSAKSRLVSFVSTRLSSILAIRVLNRQEPEFGRYQHKTEEVLRHGVRTQFLYAFVQSAAPSLLYLMLGIILVYVYVQSQTGAGRFDGGTLLTSVLLLTTIMPVLRRILRVTVKWKLGNLSINKLMATFNKEREPAESNGEFTCEEGAISIRNLDFGYHPKSPVFNQLNMEIPPREVTWIQGGIGTGKSTLIKMLLRIYSPDQGEVLVDGHNLEDVLPASLRAHTAVVSDEIPIYGRTVRDAVLAEDTPEGRKMLNQMLDVFQAHLPGHQRLRAGDKMGDLGTKMSKGQLKLLAYLRALVMEGSLIIVDEPFSNLDWQTSEMIARHLRKRKHKSTIVILSKRAPDAFGDLAHILFVDNVFRLEQRGDRSLQGTYVVESNLKTGQTVSLRRAGVEDSRGRMIFSDLSVQFPGSKISVVVAPEKRPRAFLRRILMGKSKVKTGTYFLGSKNMAEADDAFCREMVSYASPVTNLNGNTALEAVYGGRDILMREGAERMILMLQQHLTKSERLLPDDPIQDDELTEFQTVLLSTARAILSKKPVLVMEGVFGMFDPATQLIIAELVGEMRDHRTVVVLLKDNLLTQKDFNDALSPDYVAEFKDLLGETESNPQLISG